EPGPRQSVRIADVERAPETSPRARAIEKAELPVVDVEKQWPGPLSTRQQPDPEARRAWLRGVKKVAVGQAGQRGEIGGERGIAAAWPGPVNGGARVDRWPQVGAKPRTHDRPLVLRGEQPRQQLSATGRVVRQVEGEDRDPDTDSPGPRRAARPSSAPRRAGDHVG